MLNEFYIFQILCNMSSSESPNSDAEYRYEPRWKTGEKRKLPDLNKKEENRTAKKLSEWCSCQECIAMPCEIESLCCKSDLQFSRNVREKLFGRRCLTLLSSFDNVVLNTDVLDMAAVLYNAIDSENYNTTNNK